MMLVADDALGGYRLVPALIILAREFLVSGLREFLADAAVSVPVSRFAKFKTTIQMFAIGAMILGPMADAVVPGALDFAYVALWVAAGADRVDGLRLFPRRSRTSAAPAPARRGVKLLYFAWVRQKIGKSEETIALPAGVATVGDLIAWLATRGAGYADAFADPKRLRAAVNQDHVAFDARVSSDDEVAFFPPVTGG